MRKLSFILLIIAMFAGCAQNEKQVVRKEIKHESSLNPFGPFFLPENHSLSSVSLNYVTSAPEETAVLFTMVGEIDWARYDHTLTRFHKMIFKDLEESAVYQFTIKCGDREVISSSSIQTVPYGEDYQFKFVVASMENEIDNSIHPNFIVLGSERETVDEKEFYRFYERNRELLSSAIVLPLFSLDLKVTNVDLAGPGGGIYFARYKNLCLVLINRDLPNYDFITRYVSDCPEDQNVIVVSHLENRSVEEISRRTALLNCRIYAFNKDIRPEQTADNVTLVDRYQVVDIIKKPTYALVLTNTAR